MPDEIYEVISQGARYWFLFLMVLIVWRSYRWYARDRKQRRKRLRLLPDAGYVGELVVFAGSAELPEGLALPVSGEGVLGSQRGDDVYVPVRGVMRRHLWYSFDEDYGLRVEPYGRHEITVDGKSLRGRRSHAWLLHGSRLAVGEAELRLRMFAGFENAGLYHAREAAEQEQLTEAAPVAPPSAATDPAAFSPQQLAAFQQMQQMQWFAAWQAAQAQGGLTPVGAPQAGGAIAATTSTAGQTTETQGAPAGASGIPARASGLPGGAESVQPAGQIPAGGVAMPVLSTAEGDFLAPGKSSAQGSILPPDAVNGDMDANPHAQGGRTARRPRVNPLPPLTPDSAADQPTETAARGMVSSAEVSSAQEVRANSAMPPVTDAPARAAGDPTADELWSRMRNRTDDASLRRAPDESRSFALPTGNATFAPPAGNATFAPMVTFYPPEPDDGMLPEAEPLEELPPEFVADADPSEGEWPRAPYPQSAARFADSGYTYPEYIEPDGDAPYEYADEDEAPRSLYVEPDEAAQAKRMLWDRYLKGGRRK